MYAALKNGVCHNVQKRGAMKGARCFDDARARVGTSFCVIEKGRGDFAAGIGSGVKS